MKMYEVLWFEDHDGLIQDMFDKSFQTKRQALNYYEKHKNDVGKYGWVVSKRDYRWRPIEFYVGYIEYLDWYNLFR